MNNKGMTIGESLLALLIVIFVVLFFINFGPKIWELIKISIGFTKFDTNNINKEKSATTQAQIELKGAIGPVVIMKSDSQSLKIGDREFKEKPTSPDHCLVMTFVRNTGKTTWTEFDKIRATLFCDHEKLQKEDILVQNSPVVQDYITGLKPGDQMEILFSRFPNNCIKSSKKYQIILYSNCEGKGTRYKPCDNFEQYSSNLPIRLSMVDFICK